MDREYLWRIWLKLDGNKAESYLSDTISAHLTHDKKTVPVKKFIQISDSVMDELLKFDFTPSKYLFELTLYLFFSNLIEKGTKNSCLKVAKER